MIVTGPRRQTLVARGLTKVYRGGDVEVHALRGVDFALYERELAISARARTRKRPSGGCEPGEASA
jgi:hypothetical protein